jgi:enamine deaminase RidA (YjgF/YER057c/UK114 family)
MNNGPANPGDLERVLSDLGLVLPPPPAPRARYVAFRIAGSLVYISGQGPAYAESAPSYGKVGKDLTLEQAADAARRTALNVLAVLKDACGGDFSKVKQCVKLTGYVNSAPGFTRQPEVVDGATQLLFAVFGEAGLPARAAVAAPELPFNIAVELETIFELH